MDNPTPETTPVTATPTVTVNNPSHPSHGKTLKLINEVEDGFICIAEDIVKDSQNLYHSVVVFIQKEFGKVNEPAPIENKS